MRNHSKLILRKTLSLLATFVLLVQTLLPGASFLPLIQAVQAQEEPTPTQEVTPTPAEETSPTPTEEISPTPTEEVSPTPTEEVTPTITPETTETPAPTEEVAPAPQEGISAPQQTSDEPPHETGPPAEEATPTPTVTVEQPTEEGSLHAVILENTEAESLDLEAVDPSNSATLTTDKADYAPTDTAVITGTGFTPGETYSLTVSSSDEPATSTTVEVTADENGSFIYAYQLDGIYRPNYKVEAKSNDATIAEVTFTDSPISGCTNDTAGANDEPDQKDLTKMCVSYTGLPTSIDVSWNWDENGPGGALGGNTGDACSLYDTNGNGLVDYSLCVIIDGDPSVYQSKVLYSCDDEKSDRCTNPAVETVGSGTTCTANVQSTDPFPTGTDYPEDSVASCTVDMDDVGGATVAELVDVCSYPSQQPNSDPSDCILFQDNTGRLEVIKDLIPSDNTGLFNLQIDGTTEAANVGDGGTTGETVVDAGNRTVGETAGTSTSLSNYSTTISCKDLNGSGAVVASGTDAGPLTVAVAEGDDIVCTITNTLQNGTVVVHKDVQGPVGEDIFDDSTDFTVQLDDANSQLLTDGETVTYNDVVAGPHKVTESVVPAGYDLFSITPDADGGTDGAQITVVAGQTTDVYVVNRVEAQPELGTAKTLTSAETALVGETVTFQIIATNSGNVTLYNPVVYDTYDADYLQYVSSSPISEDTHSTGVADSLDYDGDGDTTELIRTLSWVLPADLDPGESYTITLTFTAIQYTNDDPTTTYTGNEAWTEACLEDTEECSEENEIATDPSPAFVDIDALGSVSGYKFVDADGEGDWDAEEGTLGGVTVNLYLSDGEGGYDFVSSDVTEADGSYSFGPLATGDYKVCEDVPTGYAQTFPGDDGCHYFSVTDNGDVFEDKNFGNRGDLTISGYKYEDEDGDASTTGDQTVLAGWVIELWQWVTDAFVDTGLTDTTDGSGFFSFENLLPGLYQLREQLQAGWTKIFPTEEAIEVTLTTVGDSEDNNFVNYENVSVTACKQADPDGLIGTTDGRTNVAGWQVDLIKDGQTIDDTQVTGENGCYTWTNLGPGDYSVSEETQVGWTNLNPTTHNFGVVQSGTPYSHTFVNTELGSITITKQTNPDASTQPFTFDLTGGAIDSSILTDGQSDTYSDLMPGSYTITETIPTGWSTGVSVLCDDASYGHPTVLSLAAGQDINCTFTNTQLGQIIIEKQTDPDGSPQSFHFDASYDIDGFDLTDGQSDTSSYLAPDVYSVSEVVPDGWDHTNTPCSDQSYPDGISLQPGETVTCVFTNTQRGHLIVHKVTDPSSDTTTQFNITASGDGSITEDPYQAIFGGSSFDYEVTPGTYSVVEDSEPGWNETSNTCDDVVVAAGETEECTITNTQYGSIVVFKETNPNGSSENFEFDASYHDENFLLTDGFADLSGDLLPGTYSVTELPEEGWDLTSATCDDESDPSSISLQSGETVVCTFTNTQRGHIIVDKVTDPAGSVQSFNFDATGTGYTDFSLTDLAAPNDQELVPGTYSVSETVPAGWDLTNTTCVSSIRDNETASNLELDAGETIRCTFTNTELGNVTVIKYNDHDGDGTKDVGDETLGDTGVGAEIEATRWEMHLVGTDVNSYQWTGAQVAGQVTFSDLLPNSFTLSEQIKSGWVQTNIACEDEEGIDNDNSHEFSMAAGQDVTCFVGNQGQGAITVHKLVDTDGNGSFEGGNDEANNLGFDWWLDAEAQLRVMGSTATGVSTGAHTVTEEEDATGYHFVGWFPGNPNSTQYSCANLPEGAQTTTADITVSTGQTTEVTFCNARDTGTIIVHKIIDADGNLETTEDQFDGEGWEMEVEGNSEDTSDPEPQNTDSNGETTFDDLKTGDYNVFETLQDGYDMLDAYCDEGNGSWDGGIYGVEVGTDDIVNCTFVNSPNGTIHGRKWNDENGNGTRFLEEEPYLAGWKIFLDENDNQTWDEGELFDITDDGSEFGWYSFEHLFPGTYSVCEVPQDGWVQTTSPACHTVDIPSGENACPGPEEQNTSFGSTCDFGNQELDPILTITKTNDAGGDKTPGSNVTFTITVTATQSAAYNVEVTDVPSPGFTYRSGSWTATSDINGVLSIPEPTYASPGVWQLGDMAEDETITLTYIADISGDQKPGLYKDLAWAFGCRFETDCEQGDGNSVLALAQDPGFVDENFAGTEVNVVKDTQSGSALNPTTGEVLGASTELPATGADEAWLKLAAIFFLLGLTFVAAGRFTRRLYV